ncbi:unnamed protein product [Urochloa humidicola]
MLECAQECAQFLKEVTASTQEKSALLREVGNVFQQRRALGAGLEKYEEQNRLLQLKFDSLNAEIVV